MNLNPLYELKERLQSSVIAGLSLLSEDFRLVRAVEQMESLAKVSPVFEKIYRSAQGLLSEECKDKADTLLDLLAFLDAVLTTQAVTNVEGELQPLNMMEGEAYSNAPYSQIAPLLDALTTAGNGHYNLVVNTHKRNPEIFSDYRLRSALVSGLNAGYSELAEYIELWLSKEDDSIVPLLKRGFDPQGKKEMVRRVHVIEAVSGAEENQWYLSQLEHATKDVRAALIYALCHSPENQETLIGFTKTEKRNSKKAAMWALSHMKDTENLEFWRTQIQKSPVSCAKYLISATSDGLSDLIAEAIGKVLDGLQKQVESGNLVLSDKDYRKLQELFVAMSRKASEKMLDIYRRLAADDLLGRMKTEKGKPVQFASQGHVDRTVSHHIAGLLADSLVWNTDQRLFDLAEELYQSKGEVFLEPVLTAAFLTKPAKEIYETYASLAASEGIVNKETAQQKQARLGIMNTFAALVWDIQGKQYQLVRIHYDEFTEKWQYVGRDILERPDIRWYQLFVNPKIKKTGMFRINEYIHTVGYTARYNMNWDAVLQHLICSSDKEICDVLGHYFYQRALLSKNITDAYSYFPMLKLCGFQGGRGLMVKILQKGTVIFWKFESMMREAPMSLADQLEELEEIKKLVGEGKIAITNWNEDRVQGLYTDLVKQLQQETK